ncbi:glycosyltransferase [Clostridium porci]|uniref:Glycosyltransferase n=1 Tax=Clostridium porci TaxID=2605778 RepID=A0A7X2NL18_9CLOT|nr:glycosyltransferase [Clostridium porci]MSS36807.1 glycosyltransferase [Clostridium porci]
MKPKSRIMYIVSSLKKCGPTNQLYEIIRNLDFTKYVAILVVLSELEAPDRHKDFEALPIHLVSMRLRRFQYEFQQRRQLKAVIKKYEPDVIHTSGIRGDVFVSQLNMGVPHCATIRCCFKEDYLGRYGYFLGMIMYKKHVMALKKITYSVFCSESLKLKFKTVKCRACEVIHNGVDAKRYFPCRSQEEKNEIKSELKLDCNKKIFVVVGELAEWKNPLLIVQAFNESRYKTNSLLIFLGKGNLLDECKAAAGDNILFLGQTELVDKYLRAADVYISASRTEGFPNSVLEAAASGTSLILSDIPQHKEMFQNDEKAVSYFELNQKKQLKHIIEKEQELSPAAINFSLSQYISESFSGVSMSRKYQKLYERMRAEGC